MIARRHSSTAQRSSSAAHSELHQVVHERLQTDIIGEDGLCSLLHTTIACRARVRRRGVELGEQETGLRTAGVADDETGQWEAVLDEFLRKRY